MTTVHQIAHSARRALLPASSSAPNGSICPRHTRAEVLHKTHSTPLLATWFCHPSPWAKVPTWRPAPAPTGHSHVPTGTGACRVSTAPAWALPGGLQCSQPPAAAAGCLLLSCPMQQPWGLGYRAVSNFVLVPRHQGRGT